VRPRRRRGGGGCGRRRGRRRGGRATGGGRRPRSPPPRGTPPPAPGSPRQGVGWSDGVKAQTHRWEGNQGTAKFTKQGPKSSRPFKISRLPLSAAPAKIFLDTTTDLICGKNKNTKKIVLSAFFTEIPQSSTQIKTCRSTFPLAFPPNCVHPPSPAAWQGGAVGSHEQAPVVLQVPKGWHGLASEGIAQETVGT